MRAQNQRVTNPNIFYKFSYQQHFPYFPAKYQINRQQKKEEHDEIYLEWARWQQLLDGYIPYSLKNAQSKKAKGKIRSVQDDDSADQLVPSEMQSCALSNHNTQSINKFQPNHLSSPEVKIKNQQKLSQSQLELVKNMLESEQFTIQQMSGQLGLPILTLQNTIANILCQETTKKQQKRQKLKIAIKGGKKKTQVNQNVETTLLLNKFANFYQSLMKNEGVIFMDYFCIRDLANENQLYYITLMTDFDDFFEWIVNKSSWQFQQIKQKIGSMGCNIQASFVLVIKNHRIFQKEQFVNILKQMNCSYLFMPENQKSINPFEQIIRKIKSLIMSLLEKQDLGFEAAVSKAIEEIKIYDLSQMRQKIEREIEIFKSKQDIEIKKQA